MHVCPEKLLCRIDLSGRVRYDMAANDNARGAEIDGSAITAQGRAHPQSKHGARSSDGEDSKAQEAALRQELADVRKVNESIEGVIDSLKKAKQNMGTVNNTVAAASSLLNTWTRILSQTEHNQRLILDPEWQGASQDITDMENEEQETMRAAERAVVEEQERRAAAAKREEEDERKRIVAAERASKFGSRGRVRGTNRGTSTAPSTPAASGSNTSMIDGTRGVYGSRRTISGISRGTTRGGRSKT